MIEKHLSNEQNYPKHSAVFDYKENPYSVMEGLEFMLDNFGLEVVSYNNSGDSYCFEIRKAKAKEIEPPQDRCTECGDFYEPAGHADVRCKNCGNHQTPPLPEPMPSQFDCCEDDEEFCSKCGKILGVEEHDANGGMCATCFGERNKPDVEDRQVFVEATVRSSLSDEELESKLVIALHDIETGFSKLDGVDPEFEVVDYHRSEVIK